MEIRELAEHILFGTTLEEKLVSSGRLVDTSPGRAHTTPDAPGRPAELALDRWSESQRVPFGDVRALERDEDRGLVLHFFANHELLAAELMALVLLKFPDAPERFRRGVAQTMKDEQEHVRLYLDRMKDAGVTFGQIPVSDFFWRAIAPMPSPMDFVTRLSLTLEQANLDYAPHYQQLFGELGDADTAALLGRIYKDEIGHVKYGLNWFNTWRSPAQSEWDSFQQTLGFPLSPSRAKGIGFNREGRLQAGFSPDFIDELDIFAHSHGRCPDLYWFNPLCDLVAGRDALFTPTAALIDVVHDLAMVPALLAANDDLVVVGSRPSVRFMQQWKRAGLALPQLVEWDPLAAAIEPSSAPPPSGIVDRRLTRLCPWGWAPDSVLALQSLADQLPAGQPSPSETWTPVRRDLYRKSWSVRWLDDIIDSLHAAEGDWIGDRHMVGTVCGDIDAVEVVLRAGFASGWTQAVMKADFGTAGGQLMQVDTPDAQATSPLLDHQRGWLRGQLRDAGAIVVEPWLDRVLDLSGQYEVEADGTIRLVGITRFLTDERGHFQGVFVSNMVGDLDPQLRRFLYGDGRDTHRLQRLFARLGDLLLQRLPRDYRGPIGIDTFVYRDADGILHLKPVVEVNPRFTMGRVGCALRKRVLTSRTAVWRIQRLKDLNTDGETWAAEVQANRPLEMTADGHQVAKGVVFTNEPEQARASVGMLIVAEQTDQQMLNGWSGKTT
ncbi:MAG: DUF455 family protein [Gemmatimonadetes bacterium]|nr:DUF455 family protein [Gemmatimonadota bacterium]